jgi:predicted transcriptional regulator
VITIPAETVKQKILQVVERLPETATLEDAIERLCFLAKVEEGLRQSDAGDLVPHAEAVQQIRR